MYFVFREEALLPQAGGWLPLPPSFLMRLRTTEPADPGILCMCRTQRNQSKNVMVRKNSFICCFEFLLEKFVVYLKFAMQRKYSNFNFLILETHKEILMFWQFTNFLLLISSFLKPTNGNKYFILKFLPEIVHKMNLLRGTLWFHKTQTK